MQFSHYSQHGRHYSHADEGKPNTFTWRSRIGERNVDVNGDGQTFAPYVLSGADLRYGESECEFAGGYQGLRRLGQTIVSRSRIFIQRETSPGVWTDVPHGLPTRNVVEDYPREGRATAYLDFPNIQGYAQGARFQAGFEAGGSEKAIWGFRLRSPVAGRFRLEWVIEIPGNVALSWLTAPTSPTDPTLIRVGGRIGPLAIRWTRAEAPFRNATAEDDGQGGKILRLVLGPYTLAAQEWLTVYPDTWGTDVGIAANEDDGNEQADTTWQVNGSAGGACYVGEYTGDLHGGMRWTGITLSGTVDTCYIDVYCVDRTGAGTLLTKWRAWDVDNAGQFGGANRPSTVTKTTAGVDDDFATTFSAWRTSPNLKDIVQEILDSYGLSNDAINFVWLDDGNSSLVQMYEDYSAAGTNEPELTITYTPGGTNYSLTCDGGSYALTGAAATPKRDGKIAADGGNYALTGADAGAYYGRAIDADGGVYALTGQDIGALLGRLLAAEAGVYALTGQDIAALFGRKIAADAGTYAVTGSDVTLIYTPGGGTYVLTCEGGVYAVAGADAGLLRAAKVSADGGAYVVTGQDAATLLGRMLDAGAGTYAVTGAAAVLLRAARIAIEAGAYAVTVANVTLRGSERFSPVLSAMSPVSQRSAMSPVSRPVRLQASARGALDDESGQFGQGWDAGTILEPSPIDDDAGEL